MSAGRDFNPRSPHGERRRTATHKRRRSRFQSTLPARGATGEAMQGRLTIVISIHAPRTGRDPFVATSSTARRHFNPRSPHGERLNGVFTLGNAAIISIHAPRTGSDAMRRGWPPDRGRFQSTLPARGATQSPISPAQHSIFQSTLPARGATPAEGTNEAAEWHFNPRSPHGERRQTSQPQLGFRYFNPRSPHGERLVEFEDEFFY